jgi:hypothetical protein
MINALTEVFDAQGKSEHIWRGGHPNLPQDIADKHLASVILLNDDEALMKQDKSILDRLQIKSVWLPLSGVFRPSVKDLMRYAELERTLQRPLAGW